MLTAHSYASDWHKEHALLPKSDVQAFFENLYQEIQKPTFGDVQRKYVQALLLRATEAGLYDAGAK